MWLIADVKSSRFRSKDSMTDSCREMATPLHVLFLMRAVYSMTSHRVRHTRVPDADTDSVRNESSNSKLREKRKNLKSRFQPIKNSVTH